MDISATHFRILRNSNIIQTTLELLYSVISRVSLPTITKNTLDDIADECKKTMNKYFLTTIGSLVKYMKSGQTSDLINQGYGRAIIQHDVCNELNAILREISGIIARLEECPERENSEIGSIIGLVKSKMYSIQSDVIAIENNADYGECCGAQMIILSETSELKCQNCFRVKIIEGVVFKNDQFFPQDGHKTKHGTYDSMRHYKFWMDHIQGKEAQTFDDDFIERLGKQLDLVQKNRRLITYSQMRAALKSPAMCATRHNDHISLLLKLCGGRPSPVLSHEENAIASFMFSRVMYLYNQLKLPNKKNKPYYPYFIYKILEQILRKSPKLRILNYIHLQSRDTMIKHDGIYKRICESADERDGLIYTATDHCENMLRIEWNITNIPEET